MTELQRLQQEYLAAGEAREEANLAFEQAYFAYKVQLRFESEAMLEELNSLTDLT